MILPYTAPESMAANIAWQASCGHHSLAAATGRRLPDIRAAVGKDQAWMNPTMIASALDHLERRYSIRCGEFDADVLDELSTDTTHLLRVQFEGSWMNPGVPVGARYQRTHYVATDGHVILDTLVDIARVRSVDPWRRNIGPIIAKEIKKSTGWHFTHIWSLKA